MDTQQLITERGRTHGPFSLNATMSQSLKAQIHGTHGWYRLTATQAESLDMICHKIGRILAGDANHVDHWFDIAGYAQLVVNELTKEPTCTETPNKATANTR